MTESSDRPFDAKPFLKSLTQRPGIYQMFDEAGAVLYVGKASNLKNRVASYFRGTLTNKTAALVGKIQHIEVTVTGSETEALLLEQNLIKSLHPPYNILLRDDKSYPYIFLSEEDRYPRLAFHRGAKRAKGRYFGPYPNSGAIRESMNFLQKTFLVRQCENSFFKNRNRPCLQYQIKRCSAPCVREISEEDYSRAVRHTILFLEGKSLALVSELAAAMEQSAAALDFEKAAAYRDRIIALQKIQEQQSIEGESGDLDIVAAACTPGLSCVQVLYVRGGRVLGSRSYFPQLPLAETTADVLEAFLPQFYLAEGASHELPREIILSQVIHDQHLVSEALTEKAGRRILLSVNVRANRARWLDVACRTAEQNLAGRLASRKNIFQRYEALQDVLGLEEMPQRLECFDISHLSGQETVASCVVFDGNGPLKSDYRRFNISNIKPGDDYAAMQQALSRRYTRLKSGEGSLPDILIIDGGKGQLAQARTVLEELQVSDVLLIGVAKGATRKAGFETLLYGADCRELMLPSHSPALHLIQQIRDEAHAFAISGHKQRRHKKTGKSTLEEIPGIGPKRRKELLSHFGGLQGVRQASVDELGRVPAISHKMAEEIYAFLHND